MKDARKLRRHKSYEEIYGKKKAQEIKNKQSINAGNDNKWRSNKSYEELYGIEKAKKVKEKQSANALNRYKNKNNHPSFGQKRTKETKEKLRISKLGDKNPAKRIDVRKKISLHSNGRKWKNKTYEEIFGDVKAKQIKQKQSKNCIFRKIKVKSWNKNLTKETDKRLLAISIWHITHPNKKFSNTSIERKIAAELNIRKINFQQNIGILNIANVDFYLPDHNIIIECDGDYWHNLSDRQEHDKRKTQQLQQKGFIVYRFWEHEINNSTEKCINQIKL